MEQGTGTPAPSPEINAGELADTLAKVIQLQNQLSEHVKKLEKENVAPLKAQILAFMDKHGMQSFNIPGCGTLARRSTKKMSIDSTEAVCRYMFWAFGEAVKQGKPLADALILQKSPHKGNVTKLIEDWLPENYTPEQFEAELAKLGISMMPSVEVGIYK